MQDTINQLKEAITERVKSPFLGSILLAFIAFNWKAIFYVIFADKTVVEKFAYWDLYTSTNTKLLYPIIAGSVFALVIPYISSLFAFLIEWPISKSRIRDENTAHKIAIQKIRNQQKLENEREEVVASKVRQEEELEKIKDKDIRAAVKENLNEIKDNLKNSNFKAMETSIIDPVVLDQKVGFENTMRDLQEKYENAIISNDLNYAEKLEKRMIFVNNSLKDLLN
jgi:hypothetical protein